MKARLPILGTRLVQEALIWSFPISLIFPAYLVFHYLSMSGCTKYGPGDVHNELHAVQEALIGEVCMCPHSSLQTSEAALPFSHLWQQLSNLRIKLTAAVICAEFNQAIFKSS